MGNEDAKYELAWCYYTGGRGLRRNYKEAATLFETLAENENHWAQFYLGECYFKGHGVEKDYNKALYWYTHALEDSEVAFSNKEDISRKINIINHRK